AASGLAVCSSTASPSRAVTGAVGVTGALSVGGAGVFSTAELEHTVKAFTDGGGSITAGSISITSNVNDNLADGTDCANVGACAHALAGAISLPGSVAFTKATATDSPDVHTYAPKHTQLTAGTSGPS